MKAKLKPHVLEWARKRAGLTESQLASKLGVDSSTIEQWEKTGEISPSKAELLAEKTFTPLGYLFLSKAPIEQLPIKDFRTLDSRAKISPNLLDVIYEAQRRQDWFREYLIADGHSPLPFLRKISVQTSIEVAAKIIWDTFGIGPRLSTASTDYKKNLALHIEAVEKAGVLVMRNSVVGNSNNRKLSVDDFRGFALYDEYAPLIFINGRDSKAAQLFTIAHELAHVCIGESAVSNFENSYSPVGDVEVYCNNLAAEILLPLNHLRREWRTSANPHHEAKRIARIYKVSTLVVVRRARDAEFISFQQFREIYDLEYKFFRQETKKQKKGNFYDLMNMRVSPRLVEAVVSSTLEGRTLYKEAMNILGVKANVIQTLAQRLGYQS